jgi:hypothetical protein
MTAKSREMATQTTASILRDWRAFSKKERAVSDGD